MKRLLLFAFSALCFTAVCLGNSFSETGTIYPIESDGQKYVVSGFVSIANQSDENIFANTLLWCVENVCPQLRDGINDVDVTKKKFSCDIVLDSAPGSGLENTYYCTARFSVAAGRLIYHLSDIRIESQSVVFKKVTPMERLNPDKKESHKKTMDDFTQSESSTLNAIFDFVKENQPQVTHWNEIGIRKPIEGMTFDECLITFGKPKTTHESGGETQWMYSTSFILFFRDGKVCTILN